MMRVKLFLSSVLLAALLAVGISLPSAPAAALSGGDFQAGRIIDDGVFFNPNTMSQAQIQEFLNAKVPVCDTNGTQPYGNTTRAEYSATKGYFPPFTCLKDYRMDTTNKTAESGLCNGHTAGNKSSAQIIYEVAQSCGVSPKVLLVLLQKEQSLITDDWPWSVQYRSATGYGCPDTAPCDAEYYGFFNQVYAAARQFKRYSRDATLFNYRANRNNYIQYNPNVNCGGSTVFIQNQATAGLYNYTPYQPNAAALNNLYGNGDGCSAYGNRNFWRLYNDWFGSPTRFNGSISVKAGLSLNKPTYHQGDTVEASFIIENTSSASVDVGTVGICARSGGINYDLGTTPVTLTGQSTRTISFSRVIDRPGIISVFICAYNEAMGGWVSDYYPYSDGSTIRQRDAYTYTNPLLTSSLAISPSNPSKHESVTASFTIQNNSSNPVTIPAIGVAVRDPNGNNVGYPGDSNVTIAPNSSYTYSKVKTFAGPVGAYRFFITSFRNNTWDDNYPVSASGVTRSLQASLQENPLVASNLVVSPSSPTLHQPVTVSFTIQNNSSNPVTIPAIGVAVRDVYGNNIGYPGDTNAVIPAGGSYVYSKTRTFSGSTGTYRLFVTSFNNNTWDDNYPVSAPGVARSTNIVMHDNPAVSSNLTLSPSNPKIGESVTASFTIQNNSSNPVTIPAIGVAVRDPNGNNVGYPGDSNVTIAPNSSYTYSKVKTFAGPVGAYRFFITSFRNNTWDDNYPVSLWGLARNITLPIAP